MIRQGRVEQRSRVDAPPDAVWDRIITPEGINHRHRRLRGYFGGGAA